MRLPWTILITALVLGGCSLEDPGDSDHNLYYRGGTSDDGYTSNGERGAISITEVNWAGSVEGTLDASVHYPDDIFIEIRNQGNRPLHLTDWLILIEPSSGELIPDVFERHDPAVWRMPLRENGQPVMPNEYVVIAARRDGAFRNADYYIEDLHIPPGGFEIELRDIDYRLMGDAGDTTEEIFAGGFDMVAVRSMERVQLLFSNQGGRESNWHAYSYNVWDDQHAVLNVNVHEDYRTLTYASPGMPNSLDYSGNTTSGSFE